MALPPMGEVFVDVDVEGPGREQGEQEEALERPLPHALVRHLMLVGHESVRCTLSGCRVVGCICALYGACLAERRSCVV